MFLQIRKYRPVKCLWHWLELSALVLVERLRKRSRLRDFWLLTAKLKKFYLTLIQALDFGQPWRQRQRSPEFESPSEADRRQRCLEAAQEISEPIKTRDKAAPKLR